MAYFQITFSSVEKTTTRAVRPTFPVKYSTNYYPNISIYS